MNLNSGEDWLMREKSKGVSINLTDLSPLYVRSARQFGLRDSNRQGGTLQKHLSDVAKNAGTKQNRSLADLGHVNWVMRAVVANQISVNADTHWKTPTHVVPPPLPGCL